MFASAMIIAQTLKEYGIDYAMYGTGSSADYLSFTPSAAPSVADQKQFVIDFWYQRAKDDISEGIFSFGVPVGAEQVTAMFLADGRLQVQWYSNSNTYYMITTQKFRDTTKPMHIQISADSTQTRSVDRGKLFIDLKEVTKFDARVDPPLDYQFKLGAVDTHYLNRLPGYGDPAGNGYGYLANFRIRHGMSIQGTGANLTDTAAINPVTGTLKPKKYYGSYGTGGAACFLEFENNLNLGEDTSGLGHNWTVNGTLTQTSNTLTKEYATIDALKPSNWTLSKGNTHAACPGVTQYTAWSSFNIPTTGKWKVEGEWTAQPSGLGYGAFGVFRTDAPQGTGWPGADYGRTYHDSGEIYDGAAIWLQNGLATCGVGVRISVEVDMDAETITFYKDVTGTRTIMGVAESLPTGHQWRFGILSNVANQFQFYFNEADWMWGTATHKSLCTTNLPSVTVSDEHEGFASGTYNGNGSAKTISPAISNWDLSTSDWMIRIKQTSGAGDWHYFDTVRGLTKYLTCPTGTIETTDATTITGRTATQISFGSSSKVNANGGKYYYEIHRVGPKYGFDIVSYVGDGTSDQALTINLNSAAEFGFTIDRDTTDNSYHTYFAALGNDKYMHLNHSAGAATSSTIWASTDWSATTVHVGNTVSPGDNNFSGRNYVLYAWAPVNGFSAFGKFIGNGSTDGPMLGEMFAASAGFVKCHGTAGGWSVHSTALDSANPSVPIIELNNTTVWSPGTYGNDADINSNGVKLRSANTLSNTSGIGYVYALRGGNPLVKPTKTKVTPAYAQFTDSVALYAQATVSEVLNIGSVEDGRIVVVCLNLGYRTVSGDVTIGGIVATEIVSEVQDPVNNYVKSSMYAAYVPTGTTATVAYTTTGSFNEQQSIAVYKVTGVAGLTPYDTDTGRDTVGPSMNVTVKTPAGGIVIVFAVHQDGSTGSTCTASDNIGLDNSTTATWAVAGAASKTVGKQTSEVYSIIPSAFAAGDIHRSSSIAASWSPA